MKILITTQYLDGFAGTELFTLSLSKKLVQKGHVVYVYSPVLGNTANIIRRNGITVTDNIRDFEKEKFDLIHSQHNVTAILARSIFPDTPMVFMVHGLLPELEQPPSLDIGIEKYIAISEEIRNHLVHDCAIKTEKIEVIRNSVDTDIFSCTKPIRKQPHELVVISNHYTAAVQGVIEGASKELGINVTHLGLPENSLPIEDMPERINRADIVVTLGRGVLEALACERNVIVFDMHGGDGIVDDKNFYEIRKNNFSGRRYRHIYTLDSFKKELLKYDPHVVKRLRQLVVDEHTFEMTIEKLLRIYADAKGCGVKKKYEKFRLYNELEFLERFNPSNDLVRKLSAISRESQEKEVEIAELGYRLKLIKGSRFWKIRNRLAKILGKEII
ncbi:MAG: glycosyltransferase [Bacillota bacterium]|nr:glycosyltransferase [Bacillota bacterium]